MSGEGLSAMQIVIDRSDFRRLSQAAQRELLELLGARPAEAEPKKAEAKGLRWRVPYELSEELGQRLLAKLDQRHIDLLRLFARKDGRVGMKEIQKATGAGDLKVMSTLQQEITRRLRHLIADPEKKASLIHWDFDATKWDEGQTTIVDGVYFVSPGTAGVLGKVLGAKKRRR